MQTLEANLLAGQPFLKDLTPEQLDQLVGCATTCSFPAGQFIFHEGDPAETFYIVTQGQAAVEVNVPGRVSFTIQTLGAGDVLGWSWLYPPYRWHFDAQARTLTRAIAFNAKCLRLKCEADHDLGYEMAKRFAHVMFDRLQATRLQLLDVYGGQ